MYDGAVTVVVHAVGFLYGSAMVQKLLDELVRDGTLKMQEYGKARVYYANQVHGCTTINALHNIRIYDPPC